jgi:Meckel syndrome type 1 protein
VDVDSAGVPWNAVLHSGNKQKYGKGSGAAKAGRWQWKRGSDKLTPAREDQAAQLAADLKSAAAPVAVAPVVAAAPAVAAAPVAAAPVPVAENAAPAAAVPVAAVAAPVVAPVVAAVVTTTAPVAATVSPLGWHWANFLEAMTANGTTAEAVLGVAAQYGVTTIPELSPRVDILEAVATALAWPAPVAAV